MALPVLGLANPVGAAGGGAVHGDGTCTLLDGAGLVVLGTRHVVRTPNGRFNDVCSAKGVNNPTGAAVQWDYSNTGLLCDGSTDWRETVSASGNATITCHGTV
jgi:hypothetical protein